MSRVTRPQRRRKGSGRTQGSRGRRQTAAGQVANYIILLKEREETPLKGMGRAELYQAGVARTAEFQRKLQTWLDEQGLGTQVATIGKPTAFPLVVLRCTPAVAKKIEMLPEVEAVVPDRGDLRIPP